MKIRYCPDTSKSKLRDVVQYPLNGNLVSRYEKAVVQDITRASAKTLVIDWKTMITIHSAHLGAYNNGT